ncbi:MULTISPECIES: methyltransferase domain-containing protein [unclassified Chelatococcus]|uniref:class I SAM-dependent methyltransferase n=1 Tax=unclassified Chelatococcus TaxID=2638111 RepID=UPI001BD15446|nr:MULTISPECIES: methyltransferase domain-containing protein [unclassified Chelatococcus]MBS7698666.1 class I SAM-dependent methyltransferase [Chelatococcus sp. YT9]MBX3554752.1 class I SAM-dependent methyltransferase [Chelatococcus sp.]
MQENAAQSAGAAFDSARSEAFAERMMNTINEAAVTLMTSVGHRTGLFDVMASMKPASSNAIATAAGLDERYVREWLGAMVTAGIAAYNPFKKLYSLPPEHAAWLTRAASPNNLAVSAQWVPMLSRSEDAIIEHFRRGGGTRYCEYAGFHALMAEESAQTVVAPLFEHILPLAPELPERLEAGIDVLDAGCGSGRALVAMAQHFPRSRFVGYDLNDDALAAGRAAAAALGLDNIRFDVRDMTAYEEAGRFDLITTFDAVHDQKDPAGMLSGFARALKPGGIYLMQDIDGSSHLERNGGRPLGAFLYTISCMHCMAVSLGQGGAGLGAMWGVELAEQMLREAGFSDIVVHRLPHDPMNAYFIARVS